MRLSVVLNTRDKLPYLRLTVRSLAARCRAEGTPQIVIVDDGSTDDTRAFLADGEDVRSLDAVIVRVERLGLAAARNAGVHRTTAPAVLFLDDDIVLGEGFLRTLARRVADQPRHVHLGNLRNVALDAALRLVAAGEPAIDESALAARCTEHAMYDAAKVLFRHAGGADQPAVWWAVVTGGNLCVPRAELDAIGGFDAGFQGWGPEDADLCYRLFRAGVAAAYHADCRLYHLDHHRDHAAVDASMLRNAKLLFTKHGKPPELLAYLRFFNGLETLDAFNRTAARRFGRPVLAVDDFRIAMRHVMQATDAAQESPV
jgi:GT2 family glycosyltransferase